MALIFTVIFVALVFTYINGFHDTADSIATVVATKVLSPRQAVLLAAITNLFGAFYGTAVAATIASGLVYRKNRHVAGADLRAVISDPLEFDHMVAWPAGQFVTFPGRRTLRGLPGRRSQQLVGDHLEHSGQDPLVAGQGHSLESAFADGHVSHRWICRRIFGHGLALYLFAELAAGDGQPHFWQTSIIQRGLHGL